MKKLAILGVTIYSFAQLANAATLNVKPYGTTQDGQKVELYTMSNNKGVSVSFISFGGVITQILTPDAQGKQNNIVLLDLYNYQQIEIPIPIELNIGFHSIFIPNK